MTSNVEFVMYFAGLVLFALGSLFGLQVAGIGVAGFGLGVSITIVATGDKQLSEIEKVIAQSISTIVVLLIFLIGASPLAGEK